MNFLVHFVVMYNLCMYSYEKQDPESVIVVFVKLHKSQNSNQMKCVDIYVDSWLPLPSSLHKSNLVLTHLSQS